MNPHLIARPAALALLTTALLTTACDQAPGPDALDEMDVDVVAHVDVRGLLNSPWLADSVDADVMTGHDMPKSCAAVLEDLDAVTMAKAKATGSATEPEVDVFLHGPSNHKELADCIGALQAKAKEKGKSPTINTTWVGSDIVRVSNGSSSTPKAARRQLDGLLASDPSPGASKVWFVASGIGHDASEPQSASGWLQLDTGLDGRLDVSFGEAAAALEARTKLQSVVVPMRLVPDVAPIADVVDVGGSGSNLTINVSADADQLQALKDLAESKKGPKSGPKATFKAGRGHDGSDGDMVIKVEI
ncbi:MAG: hypothetical protein K0V04_13355 [Deltaproteobacteria bacterium]|nr:hypothetical protein [Deltaproteobacteria bacterium]